MRRKSERTATKKGKSSPEKKEKEKVDKAKRTRTSRRGRKQSSSSENESAAEDASPQREEIKVTEVKPPVTPVKDPSPEEAGDQVWQVKSAQSSSESGEIQKLKICLTRPPSTPERVDRSPRSRRKHSRAASSSDTPSGEGSEEKKKKHHSKRSTRESKDSEKNHGSQSDDADREQTERQTVEKADDEISQSTQETTDDTPVSTTEEPKPDAKSQVSEKVTCEKSTEDKKSSAADTTVASPKQTEDSEQNTSSEKDKSAEVKDKEASPEPVVRRKQRGRSPPTERQMTVKATAMETDSQSETVKETRTEAASEKQVSNTEENKKKEAVAESSDGKDDIATNGTDVVEVASAKGRKTSTDSNKEERYSNCDLERSESVQSAQEEPKAAEPFTPIVINRKRRWGRASKVTSQNSITISSDVLKEIIPDVKPVEFEEVIEEKKHHKRVESERPERSERFDRPVLPKIVIDNTDAIEVKDDKENIVRVKELPLSNRKISIVKDNDNIIARPPSPPRHKQSCVLFISNLVRPFTLPQLKNLLQRTGRIAENGFWIDRIKSKCFVIYENEDQAVETRHALHGVTWPVSNPKTLQVDFSSLEAFENTKANENAETVPVSAIPGTVEDWLREQDLKRERGELEKPWERKTTVREWDVGKGDKDKEGRPGREERGGALEKRRHRSPERSPEPARKFKKKEEEAPAKLLDDLFRKTKTTPCIYWLPLSTETIAVKEEQRRQHMAEHERRMSELRRRRL